MSFRSRRFSVVLLLLVWTVVWFVVDSWTNSDPGATGGRPTELRVGAGESPSPFRSFSEFPWLMGVVGIVATAIVVGRERKTPSPQGAELLSHAEPWRHLFEHSSEAMVVSRPDGTYTAANRAACIILQMTEAEIKKLGRSLIVPPPGVDLDELIQFRSTTGSVAGEMQLRRKDGTLVVVEGSSSLVALEDGQRRVITVFRDVTLRKREREAALNQAHRWQAALEAAGDGLWDWNVETGEVYFSATWKRMLGYSPEEISAHVDAWKRLVHPDDVDATMASVHRHLAGETDFYRCEHRVRCKDGTYKWILDCGCVVDRADDGRPLRMLGTHKDLSESRAIQQKLADSEEKFHQAFHHAPLIMVVTNLSDGRILEANAWAQKVSGIDPSEGLGRSVVELGWFTESDRERLVALLSSQGRVTDLEMTARSRTGATVNCLVNCQLVVMGGEQRVITTLQDITARKRADAELRESRENYLGLFNTVSEAIYVHDTRGVFLDVNVGATAMYGYAKEELVGKTPADVAAPGRNDLEAVKRTLSVVFATGRPISFEFWAVRKSGQVFPKACVTHRGKYFGQDVLITTARDITAQRQAEEALLRSELRFRTLFQYSPFGAMEEDFSAVKARIDTLRAGGVSDFKAYLKAHPEEVVAMADLVRVIMVNQGASLMFGVPVEVPDQFHLSSSLSPDSLPIFAEELAALAEGRSHYHTELVGVNAKRQPINLDLTLTVQPGHEEHLDRVVVSFIDITERKVSEARIREQAALLDVTQDAILVLSLDRTVTFWNQGAERLYGISKEDALGKTYEGLVYREPPKNYDAEWTQLLPLREWTSERHHMTRTRGEVTVQKRATVVRNDQGEPKSVLLVITDVTDAKRLEAQFLRAQRLESLGSLASGVAHDLNNVLTPIIMSCDYLAETAASPQDRELIQVLGGSARRGADIVQQLLLYGRGSTAPRSPSDLGRVIKDMIQLMRETFPKDLSVSFHLPDDLWTVNSDRTQLHQVLLNLCVNARDAMPRGGSLSLRAENQQLDTAAAGLHPDAKPGPYVVVHVQDTGEGIAPEHLDRIFDPFFTTKPVGQGTGLGLASVLGIVRSHGGFITVVSKVGAGCRFSIYLPARDSVPLPSVTEAKAPARGGKNELVLVIDDEASIRATLRNALQHHGYRVVCASDGADGIAVYEQHAPNVHIVISDLMMPVMDGQLAIRTLRSLNPNLPVVAMSGVPTQRHEVERAFGPHLRFIQKPFTVDQVLTPLRELLDKERIPPHANNEPACW